MTHCPFCSDVLLRHIRSGRAYWLCRRCRMEIMDVASQPTTTTAVLSSPERVAGLLSEAIEEDSQKNRPQAYAQKGS